MGKKVAGTCFIKVDGEQLTIKGGIESSGNSVVRETVVAGFFKETDAIPYIQVTVVNTKELKLSKITGGTDMTVTAELANGKVKTLANAYTVGEVADNSEEGTTDLRFEGIAVGRWD